MLKTIRRVLIGIVAIIAALAAILGGSIVVDGLLGGGRLDAVTN